MIPVPDRLVPVRREVHLSQGVAVFAVVAALVFAIAVFHGHIADLDLIALGLLFLALSLAFDAVVVARFRRAP